MYNASILGRPSSISVISLCVHRKTNQKKFADFNKKFRVFSNFQKLNENRILSQIFEILIIHKPSLGTT